MLPIPVFVGYQPKIDEFMGSDIRTGFYFSPKVKLQKIHLEHFSMVNFRCVRTRAVENEHVTVVNYDGF